MDRDLLAGLLEREGEAFAACRHAVLSGARFWVDDLPYPASALVKTYARREGSTQKRGIATLGFADAVAALRALSEQGVRIGAVDVDDPPYHYQLFLNEAGTAAIACLGVDQSWKAPEDVS
jgi:hypothetical protein